MKLSGLANILTLLLIVALLGGEAALWLFNPLHVPGTFIPARALGLQLFHAQGPAMQPAVDQGQSVLVSAWSYWHGQPQPGDIVAFAYPTDPSVADLKRIVAVGGDRVEIRQGELYVNGARQQEPYVQRPEASRGSMRAVQVPAGSYFVLGDNRDESEDSRNYGPIGRSEIIGKRL